ncbi:unknown protein [Seminavis robusta]|uniref:Uncharacterized protein n=1 Tax=Seminavis robusta TaxID=568900 RepID=A0A9N8EE83_9STRA|nr:unknown protein [Seminavis robusta]|eukprot:Sro1051_g235720.1 n/a (280) ;mRNA; f:25958-26797
MSQSTQPQPSLSTLSSIKVTHQIPTSVIVHDNVSPKTRPRTFAEKQPYIFAYGAAISVFSPAATAYQLCKLYNLQPSMGRLARLSAPIFLPQTALKAAQMNASSPVKEYLNPWAAFAMVGVLQGGVYGHINVHFSKALELGKVASLRGVFRGSVFAGTRDTISQGMPFMCSESVRQNLFDPYWHTEEGTTAHSAKVWSSVISTSIVATYLSQGFHNFQIAMQADQSLSYSQAIKAVTRQHGIKSFYKGAEARVGLLLLVNILNELLLKPAWSPVPIGQD